MSSAHAFPAVDSPTTAQGRMAMATAERTELAELLDTLEPHEWDSPSLCEGWTVKDVAAHIVGYDHLTIPALIGRMARGRLGVHGANAIGVAESRTHSPAQVLTAFRNHLTPRGLTAVAGARIGFLDGLIHHQDIRRALDRPRPIPTARLRTALTDAPAAPVIPAKRNAAGLTLIATDLDWRHGSGPEVYGPAEALLLAVAGRAAALDDLTGAGVKELAQRLSR